MEYRTQGSVEGVDCVLGTDLDVIHRLTAAIPESNEERNPPTFASSSIVSDLALALDLCLRDEEDIVVAVKEAATLPMEGCNTFVALLLFVCALTRLRDREDCLGDECSGIDDEVWLDNG